MFRGNRRDQELALERGRAADAATDVRERFRLWRLCPDTVLIECHLAYRQGRHTRYYADDRQQAREQFGVTAAVLIERGYDPDALAREADNPARR